MTSFDIYVLVCISVLLVASIANTLFLVFRNEKTARFREDILDMIYVATLKRISDDRSDWHKLYDLIDKHSYNRMLYSFKPFKLEAWFTDAEIKMLKGDEHGD